MKKMLLALLATCFMQTPAFAVLKDVTVLTKGDQTVYLYGDIHEEFYSRMLLHEAPSVWHNLHPAALALRPLVRFIEYYSNWQISSLSTRLVALAKKEGEQCVVMLESGLEIPEHLVAEVGKVCLQGPTKNDKSLCKKCKLASYNQAKEFISKIKATAGMKATFTEIVPKIPATVQTLFVDQRRGRFKLFGTYIRLLEIIHCLQRTGIDCSDLRNTIRKEMGRTSLRDLGCRSQDSSSRFTSSSRAIPLYDLVTMIYAKLDQIQQGMCQSGTHGRVRKANEFFEIMIDASFFGEKTITTEGGAYLAIRRIRLALQSAGERLLTSLEENARENIRVLARSNMPSKVVLLAGAYHTRHLEEMLCNDGYQLWYKTAQNWIIGKEGFDILDTAVLEQKVPRPTPPPGLWARLSARL